MRLEILDKLAHFLNSHIPLQEECEAVYLMVELRKLLDHQDARIPVKSFQLIRFYADWTVHTRKDRNTEHIQAVMDRLEESLNPYPKDGDLSFLSMPHLKSEMIELFTQNDLPTAIFENGNWLIFANILSHVLADQPLIFPKAYVISEFCYVNVGSEGFMATIHFTDERGSITLGSAIDGF